MTAKINVEHLPRNHTFHIHKDESVLGTFTYVKAKDRRDEYRLETDAATLCFVRGKGRIALNGSLVDYEGKWFDIPRCVEYQILPETDTVVLVILKPTEETEEYSNWRRLS